MTVGHDDVGMPAMGQPWIQALAVYEMPAVGRVGDAQEQEVQGLPPVPSVPPMPVGLAPQSES